MIYKREITTQWREKATSDRHNLLTTSPQPSSHKTEIKQQFRQKIERKNQIVYRLCSKNTFTEAYDRRKSADNRYRHFYKFCRFLVTIASRWNVGVRGGVVWGLGGIV